MITVNEAIYRNIADLLLKSIEEKDFFNGTIEYDTEEFYSTLCCTLIVYREKAEKDSSAADETPRPIRSIQPVWWEYHLYQQESERPNDFSWREFYPYLGL